MILKHLRETRLNVIYVKIVFDHDTGRSKGFEEIKEIFNVSWEPNQGCDETNSEKHKHNADGKKAIRDLNKSKFPPLSLFSMGGLVCEDIHDAGY